MIHQPMGGAQGQASDIEITAREIQKLKKELYTIIADHSHTDFDKVWADSDRDYWMTAQEAKEYGMLSIPDDVLDNYAQEMLKKKETINNLVSRVVEVKLAAALKAQVTLENKNVSIEEFNKMFE